MRRRGVRADARLRPVPRRRDGRLGQPRGAPTTHVVYADDARRGGWAGESRRFGEGVAILVGDLAFVLADQLLVGARRGVGAVERAAHRAQRRPVPRHPRLACRASAGWTRPSGSPATRAASTPIERPLHLGARARRARAPAELLPALSGYGLPLGDAFQMRDDVIGAFGDSAVTGKPVGDDLREGKPTPLLARAVGAGRRRRSATCSTRVGRRDLDDDEVAAIQQVIVATGALDELEARIAELAAEAVARSTPSTSPPEAARAADAGRLRRRPGRLSATCGSWSSAPASVGSPRPPPRRRRPRRHRRRARRPARRAGRAWSSATASGSTPARPC